MRTPNACPICGSPDRACHGTHLGGTVVIEIPTDPIPTDEVGGPDMVLAYDTGPAGQRITIRVTRTLAERRRLQLVKPAAPKTKARSKATARDKTRTADAAK